MKRVQIECNGHFTTVRGQGACCVGAAFLNAKRISYQTAGDGLVSWIEPPTLVRDQATGKSVTVTELL